MTSDVIPRTGKQREREREKREKRVSCFCSFFRIKREGSNEGKSKKIN